MSLKEELDMLFAEKTKAIEEMEINGPEVFDHKLNDQQRLTIQTLKEENFFLNYSDTGAGKTKAAISASYYLDAKHVLIFCPNSVKQTWRRQIEEAKFVDKNNILVGSVFNECEKNDEFTFEIYNYDKFNCDGRAPKRIKSIVSSKRYDLIVFDEIHRLKDKNRETYKHIFKLVQTLKKANPEIRLLGATATPITTSNADLQGIYEILSGKHADELTMGTLANKLINANKILETCGFGYFPKTKMVVRYNGIDRDELFAPGVNGMSLYKTDLANIDGTPIVKDILRFSSNRSKIEEIHMMLKFNAYKHLIKKGTVIYTEYTYGDKILFDLKDLVEDTLHLSTCIYSGNLKETDDGSHSIDEFINGNKQVLIGTKAMCEGVDGIQKVSNRVILHTTPSVWSILHQLIGRFDRQGSNFFDEGVDVFVPMVIFPLSDGKTTSFDKSRWNMAMFRKAKANIVMGGHLEEISDVEKQKMINDIVSKLKNDYEMTEIARKEIEFNDSDFEIEIPDWERKQSIISDFNRKGKTTNSKRLHTELVNDPKVWHEYHKARHESMQTWNEIPYEYIATKIKNKNRVVGDFGCGENLMKNFIPNNKVYSFDHVAIDDTVIACDMAHTPLEDETLDIAVFSLALWGTNYEDYFKEAYRLLNYDGLMYIAEPTKAYDQEKRNDLMEMLKKNKFTPVGEIEDRGKFFYITVIKK